MWDALTSDRPYRRAWSHEKAMKHITEESGKHFDPKMVKNFIVMMGTPIAQKPLTDKLSHPPAR